MIENPQQLSAVLDELSLSSWTLAAIATLFESKLADALVEPRTLDELAARVEALPRERIARVLDVVAMRGLVVATGDRYQLAPGMIAALQPPLRTTLLGELRSSVFQAPAFVDAASRGTPVRGWHHTDPRILQAQGDSSAMFAFGLKNALLPQLADLGDRLAAPTARFLDIGAGVGSLSIAMCRAFPALHVVGLDVWDVPLGLARTNVQRAGLTDRIELRQRAIEDLDETEAYDLVWLPACFIAPSALASAMAHARAALRPGGWLISPSLAVDADEAHRAVYGMVMESWGANTDSACVAQAMTEAGMQPRVLPGPGWVRTVAAQR